MDTYHKQGNMPLDFPFPVTSLWDVNMNLGHPCRKNDVFKVSIPLLYCSTVDFNRRYEN